MYKSENIIGSFSAVCPHSVILRHEFWKYHCKNLFTVSAAGGVTEKQWSREKCSAPFLHKTTNKLAKPVKNQLSQNSEI